MNQDFILLACCSFNPKTVILLALVAILAVLGAGSWGAGGQSKTDVNFFWGKN